MKVCQETVIGRRLKLGGKKGKVEMKQKRKGLWFKKGANRFEKEAFKSRVEIQEQRSDISKSIIISII